jgi:hypothetical protein
VGLTGPGPNGGRYRRRRTGPHGRGRTGPRRGQMVEGTRRGGGFGDLTRGGDKWGPGRTGRLYTLSSINNIWNLTNTIELKHLKTVAHVDNKF